ncbi:MAG: hypothetical protein Q8T11_16225 [Elusimicrobiota bacterium]|nr:hypothetical protein [Elusimicrobiota bacterium]
MRAALLALLLLSPSAAFAAKALVVLSEPLSPSFREAYDGFLAEWGEPVDTARADMPLPEGPHEVVLALGGRAAARARAQERPLVVALAPAYRGVGRDAPTVRVAMTPSPERFIAALAAAGVKRLLAVRAAPAEPEFLRRAEAAAQEAGVAIDDRIVTGPEAMPRLLRRDGVLADGIWLAPDPASVTPETFGAAREFSRARAVPFFAPAAGLVAGEVRGDLTVSFAECGREAARAARELLAGRDTAKVVYPGSLPAALAAPPSTAPASTK